MKLYHVRFSTTDDDTLSLIFVNGKFFGFLVEDEHRDEKVAGETRIPEGEYEVDLVKYGRYHELNKEIFGLTDGAIRIKDVPNFTGIRMHWGTDESDSDGCPIVGFQCVSNWKENGKVYSSRDAYEEFYPIIRDAVLEGEKVKIVVTDDITKNF